MPPRWHPKGDYLLLCNGNVLGVIKLQRAGKICFNVLVNQNDDAIGKNIAAVYRDLRDGHNSIFTLFANDVYKILNRNNPVVMGIPFSVGNTVFFKISNTDKGIVIVIKFRDESPIGKNFFDIKGCPCF